ncbi:MAG: recombinase RecT [Pseudomonadota bacterium]|nr:recombinase RecT [Pseudomonadota bacterium]
MSTELTTTEERSNVPAWRRRLEANMPQIAEALPPSVTADKFRRVASTALARTPMLQECMESNPKAVLLALSDCAADGLLPNGKEAALVPFNDRKNNTIDLTYIPMIAGVLKRMRNSGEVSSISAEIVHENDVFEFIRGDDEKLTHKPNWTGDRGRPVAAYAIIRMASGEIYREVMSAAQIEAVKNASRAKGGPWSGPFVLEMWRKTVLKRAAKYCPLSDDRIQTMLDRDNALYDLDRAPQPTPIESRFDGIRKERMRPRYDAIEHDEVPARDINEDPETIDATPTPESGVDVGEEENSGDSKTPEVVEAKPADDTSSSQQSDGMSDAQRFYYDALGQMKKAKTKEARTQLLMQISDDPLWKQVPDSKQDQIIKAAGAE